MPPVKKPDQDAAQPPASEAATTVGSVATSNITSLRAPDGCTACSVDGVQYLVKDGRVEIDERHAAQLLGVGFSY